MHLRVHLLFMLNTCIDLIQAGDISTKYRIVPQCNVTYKMMKCADAFVDFKYCAIRVANYTCEPMDTEWCIRKSIEPGTFYLIKHKVTEKLGKTTIKHYSRHLPIALIKDSEIDIGFILRPNWTRLDVVLRNSENIALNLTMTKANPQLTTSSTIKGAWVDPITSRYNNFQTDVETSLTIHIDEGLFRIDFGDKKLTYLYKSEAGVLTMMDCLFSGVPSDLMYVTFKAGNYTVKP